MSRSSGVCRVVGAGSVVMENLRQVFVLWGLYLVVRGSWLDVQGQNPSVSLRTPTRRVIDRSQPYMSALSEIGRTFHVQISCGIEG